MTEPRTPDELHSPWPSFTDAATERSRPRFDIDEQVDELTLHDVIAAIGRLHAAVAASALRVEEVATQVDQLNLLVLGVAAAAEPAVDRHDEPDEAPAPAELTEAVEQLRAEVAAVAEVVIEGLEWMRQRAATSREVQALADRWSPDAPPERR